MPAKGLQLLYFVAALSTIGAAIAGADEKRSLLGGADLKSIVLSPAPLGPPAAFEPPPSVSEKPEAFDARADARATKRPATAKSEPATPRKTASKPSRQKATAAARKKTNPLDSFARDARRQTWPCTGGGGICNWR